MNERIPDGYLQVPSDGTASLYLDVEGGDTLQWTWSAHTGHADTLFTRLVWTDESGLEHALPPQPAGGTSGNFRAPGNLLGARLEWHNDGGGLSVIKWDYYATAPFWQRPEYFLPALLPVFLLAAAFYLGRLIDKRRPVPNDNTRSPIVDGGE